MLAKTIFGAAYEFKALENPQLKHFQAQNFGAFEDGLNVNDLKLFFANLFLGPTSWDQGVLI